MKKFTRLVKVGSVAGAILMGNALFAGDSSVNPKSKADWNCGYSGDQDANVNDGKVANTLLIKAPYAFVTSKGTIKIEPEKSYKVSGSLKLAPNSAPGKFYLGITPLDEKGQMLIPAQVCAVDGTETELTADSNPDDMVIKIKNGDKWVAGNCFIAFNVDASGKKADLPNAELSSQGIKSIEKKGDMFEVSLNGKCGMKYAAGTKVREHIVKDLSQGICIAASYADVPDDWKGFSAVFKKSDCWPLTDSVRVLVMMGGTNSPEQTTMVKDVKLEEVK